MKATTIISSNYAVFLTELKGRVAAARIGAGRVVNRELILLYWDIGRRTLVAGSWRNSGLKAGEMPWWNGWPAI